MTEDQRRAMVLDIADGMLSYCHKLMQGDILNTRHQFIVTGTANPITPQYFDSHIIEIQVPVEALKRTPRDD